MENLTNLKTRIDITKTPFSKYGSWVAINAPSNIGPLWVMNVRQTFGNDNALLIEFTKDGQTLSHGTKATPAVLELESYAGDIRVYMKDDDGFVIESSGPEIIFRAVDSKIGKRKPRMLAEIPIVKDQSSEARKVIDIRNDSFAILDVLQGRTTEQRDGIIVAPQGGESIILVRIGKTIPTGELPKVDIDSDILALEQEWSDYLAKMPSVPPDRRAQAEAAWHVMWSTFVRAEGNLAYDAMLCNKDFMTGVWSWDHCFHALGIARGDFKAAVEQFLLPFTRQDESGKMPDMWKAPDFELWGITKPPVHGWCLLKLMEIGEIDRTTLEYLYPRLVKWTEYWFNERDLDGDGVPNYTENGCDSGMDNSTVFDVGLNLETPDLSSYLVIQMQALAVVARKLGDEESAKSWESRSKQLLASLYEHFWKGDRFVCVESGTHEYDPEPSGSLILMPLVLGADLDKEMFDKCIADLESRFLSDFGIASEALASPKYSNRSYWRGPIWAAADCLIVDGLKRGGKEDLAKEIARRYCDMIKYQSGGNFENFDPKTGKGNDASGYAWSAGVQLYYLSEYLS